jgi:succinate-semialdehyde dehydrogenase/glutarate-semialdehyde dehydrogenase
MSITTIDPSTGRPLATYRETTATELDGLLDQARSAAKVWCEMSLEWRADRLHQLAIVLLERKEDLALLATMEMGKPLAESRAEVEKCVHACVWYAEHAPAMLRPEIVDTEAMRTCVLPKPLGVVFAVMPWNLPYWQVVRAHAPALPQGT